MPGIVRRAAVTQADVEKAVGAESEVSAVVIRERLRDKRRAVRPSPAQIETRALIGDQRIGRSPEPRHNSIAGGVGEVDIETAAHGIVGREGQAEKTLLCFHGSPRSFDEIILAETPDDVVRQFLGGYHATLLCGGHTHTQQMRRLGNSWYVNPGSVSLAYNWELSDLAHGRMRVDPWADYAIVTSEEACLGITFRHVPFDVDELARIVRASGRPYAEEAISIYRREK